MKIGHRSYMFWRSMFAPYSVLICLITEKPQKMNDNIKYCCAFASQCLLFLGRESTTVFSLLTILILFILTSKTYCVMFVLCTFVLPEGARSFTSQFGGTVLQTTHSWLWTPHLT